MAIEDVVTIGTIAFFVLTLGNLFDPVQQLSQLFNTVQSAGAGLKKLFELLDTSVYDEVITCTAEEAFDMSRRLAREEGILVGISSGANVWAGRAHGCRQIQPPSMNARAQPAAVPRRHRPRGATTARERIVVVPQEGFRSTAAYPHRTGDASDAEIDERCCRQRARAFELPRGLDTEVRERDSYCRPARSGGCRWPAPRWSIRPSCSTRAPELDLAELLVEQAMDRLMEGRTVVGSPPLSTAQRADRSVWCPAGDSRGRHHDDLVAPEGTCHAVRHWAGGLGSPT
jgi:hypothetical protein